VDCLGGLQAFHKRNILSYANNLTLTLAKENDFIIPKNGFTDSLILKVGNLELGSYFLCAGHTKDNIVCYVPSEKILFGGCLIKSLGANTGNLVDADTSKWPITVETVAQRFKYASLIIPGHGLEGDTSLFNYTIKLVKNI
jgi:metallo-beta-lactamase class B